MTSSFRKILVMSGRLPDRTSRNSSKSSLKKKKKQKGGGAGVRRIDSHQRVHRELSHEMLSSDDPGFVLYLSSFWTTVTSLGSFLARMPVRSISWWCNDHEMKGKFLPNYLGIMQCIIYPSTSKKVLMLAFPSSPLQTAKSIASNLGLEKRRGGGEKGGRGNSTNSFLIKSSSEMQNETNLSISPNPIFFCFATLVFFWYGS